MSTYIYIVEECAEYEGCSTRAVFSTESNANSYKEKLSNKEYILPYVYFQVTCYEVDGELDI